VPLAPVELLDAVAPVALLEPELPPVELVPPEPVAPLLAELLEPSPEDAEVPEPLPAGRPPEQAASAPKASAPR
jgi:hypothetical protein